MTADDAALRQRFREIASERLRTLNHLLLELEQHEGDAHAEAAAQLADRVMREIHTLKGEARMVGLRAVQRVTHRTEDLLLLARREGRLGNAEWLQPAYDGLDLVADLLDDLTAAARDDEPRSTAFAEAIEAKIQAAGGEPPAPAVVTSTKTVSEEGPRQPEPPPSASPPLAPGAQDATQRVRRATIDAITRTAGEVGVLQAHLQRLADEATRLLSTTRDTDALEDALRTMRDVGFEVSLRQRLLQDEVESMRLAHVSTLLDRYPRAVRDLCRELGKEARVLIEGGHVGADQQVLDHLADPLLHLLRNAVDHGLEPPETREAAGKPRHGTIRLRAAQAGRFVELLVEDDGRGIDPRAIADAAVRRGLLSEADVGRMPDSELFAQLFRPAFSTRQTATDVSGRGVGLDVVKRSVEDLGGRIGLDSELGRGTTFTLRLPVSIALVDALVFEIGTGVYAVPSAYVDRVVQIRSETDLESAGARRALRLRDEEAPIPVVDLDQVLGLASAENGPPGAQSRLVVIADEARRLALRVPRFLGERTLVQEALDPFLRGLRLLTGTAMLDGGRRVSLLNPIQLFELVRHAGDEPVPEETEAASVSPSRTVVLVVEDSDLTRSLVVGTLLDAGYHILEAVNGREALDTLENKAVDLVITDLEMPVLDGFELIRGIRKSYQHADVPVLVFTTRETEGDRQRAADAGADVYLLKSAFERDDVLSTVERLLTSPKDGER